MVMIHTVYILHSPVHNEGNCTTGNVEAVSTSRKLWTNQKQQQSITQSPFVQPCNMNIPQKNHILFFLKTFHLQENWFFKEKKPWTERPRTSLGRDRIYILLHSWMTKSTLLVFHNFKHSFIHGVHSPHDHEGAISQCYYLTTSICKRTHATHDVILNHSVP